MNKVIAAVSIKFYGSESQKNPSFTYYGYRSFGSFMNNSIDELEYVPKSNRKYLGDNKRTFVDYLNIQRVEHFDMARAKELPKELIPKIKGKKELVVTGKVINLKKNAEGVYVNLTADFLANEEFLKLAYLQIKDNVGVLATRGIKDDKLRGLDGVCWFKKVARAIKEGTYKFTPMRRVQNSKSDSFKKRFSIVASPIDQIIFKAIQIILEEIYERKEKLFKSYSHGFRPQRGCHTALKEIKSAWRSIP